MPRLLHIQKERKKQLKKMLGHPLTRMCFIVSLFHFFFIATPSPRNLLASGSPKCKIIITPLSMKNLQFTIYMASSKWECLQSGNPHILNYADVSSLLLSHAILPSIWLSLKLAEKIITLTANFLIRWHLYYQDTELDNFSKFQYLCLILHCLLPKGFWSE